LIAVIYKSTGSFYLAKDDAGDFWTCRIRGKLKTDTEITSTNPVAVGDKVLMSVENREEKTALIKSILPRNNYFIRSSPHNRFLRHILAANIDQALLITTIEEPRTSLGFIDRFLVTAEAYHIPVFLIFNKSDKHQGKVKTTWEHQKGILEAVGYPTLAVSALHKTGTDLLEERLKGKISLFCGHSGSGKSTLINLLAPDLRLRVGSVSSWSGKGRHTTTFAEMADLPTGGRIIDTPGIKELGIVDMARAELAHYFPEMKALLPFCKFNNCIHVNEPGCAVKKALAASEVSKERYQSYLNILESL
jgi:ribosome biogenesis GTPase